MGRGGAGLEEIEPDYGARFAESGRGHLLSGSW